MGFEGWGVHGEGGMLVTRARSRRFNFPPCQYSCSYCFYEPKVHIKDVVVCSEEKKDTRVVVCSCGVSGCRV